MRGARLWFLSVASGVVVAVLLGIHMIVLHLDNIVVEDPRGWTSMIGRSEQGIWAGVYIALLAFVLFHALYGLRNIIAEVTTSTGTLRFVTWLFVIIGLGAFGLGTYVPIFLLGS